MHRPLAVNAHVPGSERCQNCDRALTIKSDLWYTRHYEEHPLGWVDRVTMCIVDMVAR